MNKAHNLMQQMQPAHKTTDKILMRHNAIKIGAERAFIDYQHPMPLMQLRATSGFVASQKAVFDERIATAQSHDDCLDCF